MQDIAVDARPLRWAGAASLAGLAALPLVPAHDTISCPLRATTGVPCPFCGLTRGVSALVHGDLVHAFALNPLSLLLVGLVVASFLASFGAIRRTTVRIPMWVPILVLGALWSYQLFKYATGRPL